MLYFENDYCEGAHPAILQKLAETNFEKVPGYGTDPCQRCSMDAMTMALVWVPPEMKVTSASGQPQAAQIFALALAQ